MNNNSSAQLAFNNLLINRIVPSEFLRVASESSIGTSGFSGGASNLSEVSNIIFNSI